MNRLKTIVVIPVAIAVLITLTAGSVHAREKDGPMSFDVTLHMDFDDAVEQVIRELKKEGFGVLTRINLHEAFKEKLNADFHPYVILGACNPQLSYAAVKARPEIGLFLPCNVTVEYMGNEESLVRIINPKIMMQMGGIQENNELAEVSEQAYRRLIRVSDALKNKARKSCGGLDTFAGM